MGVLLVKWLVFILCLLASPAFGTIHTMTADSIGTQKSLTSAYDGDTIRIDGTKITVDSSGLRVTSGTNIYFDFGTDTLSFGNGNVNQATGLVIAGGPDTVNGGYIIQGGTGDTCTCIILSNANNIYFTDVFLFPQGRDSKGLNSPSFAAPGNYNVEWNGGGGASFVTEYTSRCAGDANFLWFGNHYDDSGDYAFKVHDVVIDSCPGVGINVSGCRGSSGDGHDYAEVYDNTINCDAVNTLYTYPEAQACFSAGNAYGLALGQLSGGSLVYGNTVTSGNVHQGGRGIIMADNVGTSGNRILVYNNSFDCHEGPDAAFGIANFCQSGRFRWGNIYIDVYNNTFITTTADTSAGAYTNKAYALRIQGTDEEGATPDHHNRFYNNIVTAVGHDDTAQAIALTVEQFDDLSNQWYNNHYTTSYVAIRLSDGNGGCNGFDSENDTVTMQGTHNANFAAAQVGLQNQTASINNTILDWVLTGGATENSINWPTVGFTSFDNELELQRTAALSVVNAGAEPINGAFDTLTNVGDSAHYTGTTNVNGVDSSETLYRYFFKEGTGTTLLDTSYGLFTWVGWSGDQSESDTITLGTEGENLFELILNIAGTGVGTKIRGWKQ